MLPFGDMHPNLGFGSVLISQGENWQQLRSLRRPRIQGSLRQGPRRPHGQGLRHPVRARLEHPALPLERVLAAQSGEPERRRRPQPQLHRPEDLPLRRHRRPRLQPAFPHPPARRRRVLLRRTPRLQRPLRRPERRQRPADPVPGAARRDARRLHAHSAVPARLRQRHRPLRRRRLRRRAVATVPEADARRRRPYPEGLRRSGPTTSCRSARPPSSTTSCPTSTSS